MARYLILGAGKFGRLALSRLAAEDPAGDFVVVDRDAAALAATAGPNSPKVQRVEADVIAYLGGHLRPGAPWDWLIPMVPVHVAFGWLRTGPLAGPAWEVLPVPDGMAASLPVVGRGRQGELFLSRAAHICPDDCSEAELVCPVSGESRETPLYKELQALRAPGFEILVVASRQLAPGVGGYPPRRLAALLQDLPERADKIIVATACRCHGVAHAVGRKAGKNGGL
jgi:hypothetical protein